MTEQNKYPLRIVLHPDSRLVTSHPGKYKSWIPGSIDYLSLQEHQAIIKPIEEKLAVATEALKFYAKAKVLFFVYNESDWIAKDPNIGILGSGCDSETHVKDDGDCARQALAKIK